MRKLASRFGYDPQLFGPAVAVLALRLANVSLEFLCGWLLIWAFGTSAYGTYAWVLAVAGVLVIPAAVGFDRLLIREAAALVARQQWGLLRGAIRRAHQIVVPTSCTLAAIAAAVAFVGSGDILVNVRPAFMAAMILVPLLALNRVRLAILQGLGKVVLGLTPEMIIQPAAILLLTGVILSIGLIRPHPVYIVAIHLGAAVIVTFYGRSLLNRHLPYEARHATPAYATRSWILAALPLAWMLGMNLLMISIDTILVGIYSGAEPAAVYRIASQLAMLTALPLTAVNAVLAPSISRLYVLNDVHSLQSATTGAAGAVLIMALTICVAIYLFGGHALALFGPEFASGEDALLILSLGYLFNAAMGPTGYLLVMTKYQVVAAGVFTAVAALNAAGGALLIPSFGLAGAAASTAASLALLSATFAWLVRRHVGICSTAIPRNPTGPAT